MKSLSNIALFTLVSAVSVAAVGCAARDAEMYRTDTRKLLESKSGAVEACYNAELKQDRMASGKVVVRFKVEADSGKIKDAAVDEAQSKGSKTLGACVVNAINGLVLDPGDKREGDATFTWEFEAKG